MTTVEIPSKSGLGRTDSKRQSRRHPPAQHRHQQPFWDSTPAMAPLDLLGLEQDEALG